MAQLIKTSGETLEIEPKNKRKFSLQELQGFVGGYIEAVQLGKGLMMICNEEGKLRGLDVNVVATERAMPILRQLIVGDVVICKRGQM